ncbi:helix-turn-helix domain-containing protein [Listeria seeligeri]|uniref:helix-turn-helix domain-containing protein n=1 Tax=Listeria seeligeri TaxID=1640 RepID=UPI0016294BEE|nr:helix-turn-helix transcriptional regulator [Listeria seeligeri]MBC1527433.1 helix-turn-helix transcriptional regulator [Listeria seeligeri]MBC1731654.1 helix-turn-helix transcriptional regulator [Listeria seeligeri]MBC1809481.1 helix-turn-helix transcriptional regulator [Listeria seeligeri]MBC1894279.1 helix-turn-helix transcriptional regulator [Listeria seeligeri]MBC1942091.1 helix-turn-helix transcriptional regulator [Listeria seeligeri]
MDYFKRIRELREDNDYKQREIAKLLNVGQRTYADYEYNKTRIPIGSMIILAKFYNVDMNYICGISDVKNTFPI